MLVRPWSFRHRRSSHASARSCFPRSRGSREYRKTLASTKHRPVIELLALGIRPPRTFQVERLLVAPRPVRVLVLARAAHALAQHLAYESRKAHVLLSRVDARPGGSAFVQSDRDVLHSEARSAITRIQCSTKSVYLLVFPGRGRVLRWP